MFTVDPHRQLRPRGYPVVRYRREIPSLRFYPICRVKVEAAFLQSKNAARPQDQRRARTARLCDDEPAVSKFGPSAVKQGVDTIPDKSAEMQVVKLLDLHCPRRSSVDG